MLLKDLTQTFGVSGREKQVANLIIRTIENYVDEMFVDDLGNIIALKRGSNNDGKKIMISSHMDEIGFAVLAITDKGYVKVRNMGGISVPVSVMNKVKFENGAVGVLCHQDGVAKIEGNDVQKLYVDIGATSKEDALRYVSLGETACYIGDYHELPNNRIIAKAMDNRVGCYIAIESLKRLERPTNDVYFVFSVQEELGLRGATVATYRIKPDIGIALDITGSYDVPESNEGNMKMGEGAAIKMMDRSVVCDECVVQEMIFVAERHRIPYQMDILPSGGTDAGAINISRDGVRTGGISIPARNGHSPVTMIDLDDVEACIELLAKFVDIKFDF